MSSAIEVLNHLKRVEELHVEGLGNEDLMGMLTLHKRNVKVLSEIIDKYPKALLALEQKEKLIKWLNDKEIKLKDIKEKGWSLEQLAGKQILINEIRKEVLELMK